LIIWWLQVELVAVATLEVAVELVVSKLQQLIHYRHHLP
jgi:hypothetical protein